MNKLEKELDVLLKIDKEDVHLLSYILESEDNLANIRKYENQILRIITTSSLLDEVMKILNSLKEKIKFEIIEIKENSGSAG
ncbi:MULTISPECIES: DUF4911 domain-containing protein [Thermosipho]|uniref:DUF4911 domain-containing protein n=1 Tax=Thermosipho TaxID=2420 RepID=UPI001E41811A|nr:MULTISPECIES: DUF4911 domain-containing protein [Thermosipho]MDK2840276.1 hypothetical protein [Thermosipho sp. (in: thermotogales)]MDK2900240.1 hypothetical protein [Thermosipho sp. (in: thermotogales)]